MVRESVRLVGFRLVTWLDARQLQDSARTITPRRRPKLLLPLRRFGGGMAALAKVKYRVRTGETPARDTTYRYSRGIGEGPVEFGVTLCALSPTHRPQDQQPSVAVRPSPPHR